MGFYSLIFKYQGPEIRILSMIQTEFIGRSGVWDADVQGIADHAPIERLWVQYRVKEVYYRGLNLVAEWIHFTLFGIILPTIKQYLYTFLGAYELSN